MPLLAEAWSDAHLNLDTLDADTRQAEAKLKKVVERLQRQLKLRLKVDKSDADRALADIERSAKQVRAEVSRPIDLSVTTDTTDAAAQGRRARDAAEAGAADDIDVTARVGLDDGATRAALDELAAKLDAAVAHVRNFTLGLDRSPFDADLAELQPALDYLNGLDVDIIARMDGDEALQAKLTSLLAGVEALDGRAITFRVDDNGVPRAEADVRRLTEGALTELRARLSALDRDVTSIDFDADPAVVDAAVAHIKAMVEELRGLTAKVTLGADDDVGRLALERYKAQLDAIDGRIIKARLEAAQTPTSHKNLQSFEREIKELTKGIKNVRMATDTVQANTLLDRFRVRLHKLTSEVYDAEVGVDDIVGQAKILELLAMLKHLDGMTADVQVDIDGAAKAIAELGAVGTIAEIVDKQKVNIGVDGATSALNGLSLSANSAASAVHNLSGFKGLGTAAGGIGGLIALASAFAAVIPGAIGAGVAFLGLGAAAVGAAGGLAALAVMMDDVAKAKMKNLFDGFKEGLIQAFEPVTDLIADRVAPALFTVIGDLAAQMAPLADQVIVPITESLLAMGRTLGPAIAPLVGPVSQGLASFIDELAMFMPLLTPVAQMLTGPFFDALNGIVDLLFGTATSAAPVLAGALNAIGDGARALIDPLNRVVESMKAVFDFGDGPNPFTEILGQAGPMFEDFATGVFEAVRVIAEAINSIGLGNLLALASLVVGPTSPLGAMVLVFSNFGAVVAAIRPALEGIAPILAKIGELVSGVFTALVGAVSNFLAAIDYTAFQEALAPVFQFLQEMVGLLGPVLAYAGTVLGQVVNLIATYWRSVTDSVDWNQLKAAVLPFVGILLGGLRAVQQSLPTVASALAAVGTWIGNNINLLSGFTLALTRGVAMVAQGVSQVASFLLDIVDTVVHGFARLVSFITDTVVPALLGVFKPLGDLPVIGDAVDSVIGGLESGAAGVSAATNAAADGMSAWKFGAEAAMSSTAGFLSRFAQLQQQLADGKISLNEFFGEMNTAFSTKYPQFKFDVKAGAVANFTTNLERLRSEYKRGKLSLEDYNDAVDELGSKLFPTASAAARKLSAAIVEGSVAGTKASDLLVAAADQSKEARGQVLDAFSGSNLGSDFILPEEVAAGAESRAKRINQAFKEFLGEGSLSSFVNGAERNVVLALNRLIRSLDQKADNIRRLKVMESLGFGDLAAQLATVNADPGVLGKYLDQLFGAGTEEMARQNARLAVRRDAIATTLKGLGPAVGSVLGGFDEQAVREVGRGTTNIGDALDKMVDSVRLKGENIRRLARLQDLGFGDLAVELAKLNDDPAKLKAALDQLANGAAGGYAAANARIHAAGASTVAAIESTNGKLREALGGGQVEDDAAVAGKFANIGDAIAERGKIIALQVSNVLRLAELETFAPNLTKWLADENLDPQTLAKYLDQLGAAGKAQVQKWDAEILAQSVQNEALLDASFGRIKAKITEFGVEAAARKAAAGVASALGFGPTPGEQPPATEAERQLQDVITTINGLSDRLTKVGQDAGTKVADGVKDGLGSISTDDGAKGIAGQVPAAVAKAIPAGLTSGIALGRSVGAGLVLGMVGTSLDPGLGAMRGQVDTLPESFSEAGHRAGAALPAGILDTLDNLAGFLGLRLNLMGIVAGGAYTTGVQTGLDTGMAGVRVPVDKLRVTDQLSQAGLASGRSFADGLVVGLATSTFRVTLAAIALGLAVRDSVNQALGINSPSRVGIEIGGYVTEGIAKGMSDSTAALAPVARSLGASVTEALATSFTPGNYGTLFGTSLVDGMTSALPAVTAASLALSQAANAGLAVKPLTIGANTDLSRVVAEQSDLAQLNAAQQQAPQPATSPSTDILLQQILAALRNLDASTDPMVLAMLQQILDGQQAPMTLDQHAAAAAMAKALSR